LISRRRPITPPLTPVITMPSSLLAFPADYVAATAASGKGAAMPAFRAVYSAEQLRDIAGYISTTLAAKKK
jgi:mono/diheme cytochrome c family protein